MKVVILCGGAGTRFENVYPKPLNLINGTHMIWYVIQSLQYKELTIIYNKNMEVYSFPEYLKKTFPSIKFEFIRINFQTRGPAETLYVGLKNARDAQEQVLVLDNDNIYTGLGECPSGNFVLSTQNRTGFDHYSFLNVQNGQVQSIHERDRISDDICIGGYGFESIEACRAACHKVVTEDPSESFLSKVVHSMMEDGRQVKSVFLPDAFSIGTDQEILINSDKLTPKKLRVVVDLDNTLVTLGPSYSNVEPIPHMVKFIRHLKSEGHEVVIHTARGMVTAAGNVGKLTKNIGRTTLDSLDRMEIPYDEIVFGKPYGDIYIDDKAFNTYQIDLFKDMGFYNYRKSLEFKFGTNRYNRIIRIGRDKIMKTGPNMDGEIYFYRTVQSPLLPRMYSYDTKSITTEYINGTSLDNLYAENLLPGKILEDLIKTVQDFHRTDLDDSVEIQPSDIREHYLAKFEERAAQRECYPFADFDAVRDALRPIIEREFMDLPINNIIHGDLWFSNIILYKGKFVFVDMRGKFGPKLTIKGNTMYDWAKLYQSIVGLDMILSRDELPERRLDDEFFGALNFSPENVTILRHMTAYTIFCTFPFYCSDITQSQKDKIWSLVKELVSLEGIL
jgi:capsule biosynthesis phosphatase